MQGEGEGLFALGGGAAGFVLVAVFEFEARFPVVAKIDAGAEAEVEHIGLADGGRGVPPGHVLDLVIAFHIEADLGQQGLAPSAVECGGVAGPESVVGLGFLPGRADLPA